MTDGPGMNETAPHTDALAKREIAGEGAGAG